MDRVENEVSDNPDPDFDSNPKPSVLIFLPGINEINNMHRVLNKWTYLYENHFFLHPVNCNLELVIVISILIYF